MSLNSANAPSAGPRRVAVLGPTGILGPCVVAALVRGDSESEIICLDRGTDGQERTLSALK